jgi:hypothetical protein
VGQATNWPGREVRRAAVPRLGSAMGARQRVRKRDRQWRLTAARLTCVPRRDRNRGIACSNGRYRGGQACATAVRSRRSHRAAQTHDGNAGADRLLVMRNKQQGQPMAVVDRASTCECYTAQSIRCGLQHKAGAVTKIVKRQQWWEISSGTNFCRILIHVHSIN